MGLGKDRAGRNPTAEQLEEAKRLASLYSSNPQNHPNAIRADHSRLAHINTYGSLPEYYVDVVFEYRDCGKEEIWLAESQQWYFEVAKGHISSRAIKCHACRKEKFDDPTR
jgi:hypothetical protein